jgi:5S rRNA maturation endonuclease (ribonuclease M5)
MQMYNCSLHEALKIICSRVKPSYTINVEQKPKERKQIIITFEEKPFNDLELKYWEEIGITVEDLEKEGVKVPMRIYRNGIAYNSSTMTFCYTFPSYKGVKLYRPYGMKPSYHVNRSWWKWDCSSDIPFTHVENLDLIHESENLIITKSRKDRMVISKHLGIQSVSTQSENPNSLTPGAAELIKSKCKNVYVLFDNDSQGRSSSKAICEKYGFGEMLIPENVEKDPSEIIRKRGKSEFIKIMLNLLNN